MERESSVTFDKDPPALGNKAQSADMRAQYREHGFDVYGQDVALTLRERTSEEAHESANKHER